MIAEVVIVNSQKIHGIHGTMRIIARIVLGPMMWRIGVLITNKVLEATERAFRNAPSQWVNSNKLARWLGVDRRTAGILIRLFCCEPWTDSRRANKRKQFIIPREYRRKHR